MSTIQLSEVELDQLIAAASDLLVDDEPAFARALEVLIRAQDGRRAHPFPGNVLQSVGTFRAEYGSDFASETRFFTENLEDAAVVTSLVEDKVNRHRPVIDIDLPIQVIPSSTRGHFHLYIDKEMSWDTYLHLLHALVYAGIVEEGYLHAAERRGFTAVRLPWITKEAGTPMRYRTANEAARKLSQAYPLAGLNGSGYARYQKALHEAYMAGFSDGVDDANGVDDEEDE